MSKVTLRAISWIAGPLLVVAVIASLQFQRMQAADRREALEALGYFQFDTPRVLANLRLVDRTGVPAPERLRGNWSLIFFGFTRCPDVCPTTLSVLRQAARGISAAPNIAMVSVDPRDDIESVERYVTGFDPAFFALAATPTDLPRVTEELGIRYFATGSGVEASITHPALLVVLNPEGHMTGYLRPPHHIANIHRIFQFLLALDQGFAT